MRRLLGGAIFGLALAATPSAPAQTAAGGGTVGLYSGTASIYGAPGNYGMMYGTPSYGVPRTYSSYSSPYGVGYGYGYAPYGYLPGKFGVGLWRPGFETPGYVYGSSYYQTFPVPFRPLPYGASPGVGYYAPGFGAPAFPGQ